MRSAIPRACHLTAGQTHDFHGSDVLLPRILPGARHLIADKGYDADKRVLDLCKQRKAQAAIPPRAIGLRGGTMIKRFTNGATLPRTCSKN